MPTRHFDFEINNFDDVTEHLDALWYEFNELIGALGSRQPCTDPPDTCGVLDGQQQSRPDKKVQFKRPVKKAKR
jgi:hypothetical protein